MNFIKLPSGQYLNLLQVSRVADGRVFFTWASMGQPMAKADYAVLTEWLDRFATDLTPEPNWNAIAAQYPTILEAA